MNKFTKEQLAKYAKGCIEYAEKFQDIEIAQQEKALFEIALAALTAEQEPVAYADPQAFRNFHTGATRKEWMWRNSAADLIPLYAAPQLPQPFVPDEMTAGAAVKYWSGGHGAIESFVAGCNFFRAAMLQGAEPVSQPFKLRDGWVAVPVEPTENMVKAGASAASSGWLLPWIYQAMLAAAPQQEVKP